MQVTLWWQRITFEHGLGTVILTSAYENAKRNQEFSLHFKTRTRVTPRTMDGPKSRAGDMNV